MITFQFKRAAVALPLVVLIAGCSSSSSTSSSTNEAGAPLGFETRAAQAAELQAAPEFENLSASQQAVVNNIVAMDELSAPETLPSSAGYSGALLVANDEFVADGMLSLTVGFDEGDVTGTISSVNGIDRIDGESFALGGVLDVAGSVSENVLSAGISGTLTAEGELTVSGDMGGEFRGDDAEQGAGGIILIIRDEDEAQTLDGGWHVSRD